MKTTKSKVETVEQPSACCGPTVSETVTEDVCCDQPADGGECCDKSAPKEVNSEKTGCC